MTRHIIKICIWRENMGGSLLTSKPVNTFITCKSETLYNHWIDLSKRSTGNQVSQPVILGQVKLLADACLSPLLWALAVLSTLIQNSQSGRCSMWWSDWLLFLGSYGQPGNDCVAFFPASLLFPHFFFSSRFINTPIQPYYATPEALYRKLELGQC